MIFCSEEQSASLRRRLEVLEDENGKNTSASHAAALRETKLEAELEAVRSEMSHIRTKKQELEEQLAIEQDRVRSMQHETDMQIRAFKVPAPSSLHTVLQTVLYSPLQDCQCFLSDVTATEMLRNY